MKKIDHKSKQQVCFPNNNNQRRLNLSIWSTNLINDNKISMLPRYFSKPIDIFWTADICHVSVVLPTYCTPLFIYSSSHPSIIPSINHETDGLSGVRVRTDGFPLPQPYHYAPPPTPTEPHITHTHIHIHTYGHTSCPLHLHHMGQSFLSTIHSHRPPSTLLENSHLPISF